MPTIDDDLETLRSYMRQGLIIKMSGSYPFSTPHPHRFVILNIDPNDETIIVAPHATHQAQSELQKALRQGENAITVPIIPARKYNFFPEETAFNCNELHPMTLEKLAESLNEGELLINFHESLDQSDMQRLIDGAIASTQTSPLIANLITGQ